jgi:hypothetical protein
VYAAGVGDDDLCCSTEHGIEHLATRVPRYSLTSTSELPANMSTQDLPHKHDSQFHYLPLDDAKNEIRILILLPGKYTDDLICDLIHVPLSHGAAASLGYQALSYTWGEPGTETAISLNCLPFMIRPNLEVALRHIRLERGTVWLWVDAICIDQDNISERNDQVKLMRDVYHDAARVLVWLGEEYDDSGEAMAVPPTGGAHPSSEEELNWLTEHSRWKAVIKLIDRAWWNRVWVIQEVSVAQEVLVLCGDKSVPWDLLLKYYDLSYKIKLGLGTAARSPSEANPSIAFNITYVRKCVQLGRRLGFLELLQLFRTRESTDPRDKIFGILSLVADDRERAFEVDYSMTVNKLYQKLVYHVVTTSNSLNVLAWAWSETRRHGLPSWAPDWSVPLSGSMHGSESWRWGTADELHSAGRSTKVDISFTDDLDTLKVRALVLQKVGLVASMHSIASSYFRMYLEDGIIEFFRKINWFRHGSEDVTRETFRRTLIANCLGGKSISKDSYTAFSDWFDRENAASKAMESRVDASPAKLVYTSMVEQDIINKVVASSVRREYLLSESAKPVDEDLDSKFFAAVIDTSKSQSFFLLQNGFMGLGPKTIEDQDIVCIPLGGEVPFVIRDKGDGYHEFIGECYLHSAMNGEFFEGVRPDDYGNLCRTISLR